MKIVPFAAGFGRASFSLDRGGYGSPVQARTAGFIEYPGSEKYPDRPSWLNRKIEEVLQEYLNVPAVSEASPRVGTGRLNSALGTDITCSQLTIAWDENEPAPDQVTCLYSDRLLHKCSRNASGY